MPKMKEVLSQIHTGRQMPIYRTRQKTKHGPMARFEMCACEVQRCVKEFLVG